jgi:hypothetical protein
MEGAAVPEWHAALRGRTRTVVPLAAWCALTDRLWPGARYLRSSPTDLGRSPEVRSPCRPGVRSSLDTGPRVTAVTSDLRRGLGRNHR